MQKNHFFYNKLVSNLTNKDFLKTIKMSKKSMLELLQLDDWKENVNAILEDDEINCKKVLEICKKTLKYLSIEPEFGWMDYIYHHILSTLFPENPKINTIPECEAGRLFYLEVLRTFFKYEKENTQFNPRIHFEFLTDDEIIKARASDEYKILINLFRTNYIYEFMRIGSEITKYKTLAHICGVHYVSMYIGRQLEKARAPIDLALVSGAALGHDIGKYGCKSDEVTRIPYLHYYYTDKYFKKNNMPTIGHIATNHSTWDLELENLSIESLILIYADFRVKSLQKKGEKESVHFLSLKDSFDVILNKLDNVDDIKRERYVRVYAKLKDFENYMEGLGINTDLTSINFNLKDVVMKDPSLLNTEEIVQMLKHLTIQHNVSLMNKLNDETTFGNLLEAARSEKDWKNIRAYLNIFQEYFTYLTQKQKLLTLKFLYELLMHREGDIRRHAADLMGNIIVHYDEEYRKEIPEGVERDFDEITSLDLWKKYLASIIVPDHKVTNQHKRWIGYTLKIIINSVLTRCKNSDRIYYLNIFLQFFNDVNKDDSTAFILLDSMLSIPFDICANYELEKLIEFVNLYSLKDSYEIKIAILRFINYFLQNKKCEKLYIKIQEILKNVDYDGNASIDFLKGKISSNLGTSAVGLINYKETYSNIETNPDIFLENLKDATPWVIKLVNIELLLEQLNNGKISQVLHVATHFSNLIKICERVAVRHSAGQALLFIAPVLSFDQRNEIVIELTKGLEIGEYEFSKYIPEYLGELALYLHPNELDEFINTLKKLLENTNDRVCSVTLNTLGVLIQNYPIYKERFNENESYYIERREAILGLILKGLANYRDTVSQEAFLVIGQYIFGSKKLTIQDKYKVFAFIYKKLLTLIAYKKETELSFFNNAASLNHIYRFISDYIFLNESFEISKPAKIAFFPGTFDPFSLSHKGIVKEIKNLGFEVFLALDEFSWSKKTQPRMIRRQIINMSVANEGDVYLFPDEIPINIANPLDLKRLKRIFPYQEIYIVVGSDVVMKSSSYLNSPVENSIHSFNHVIFKRTSFNEGVLAEQEEYSYKCITGNVIELSLPMNLEDISSTRIRENIDYNRDISNLIDPLAQSFIYENSLYLREPQYKQILKSKAIQFETINKINKTLIDELMRTIFKNKENISQVKDYLCRNGIKAVVIRDGENNNTPVGLATFHHISISDLYSEFRNPDIAAYVRRVTSGNIVVISGIISSEDSEIRDIEQLALTELLAYCLKDDYTYAIYHDYLGNISQKLIHLFERQGFIKVDERSEKNPILAVDMKFPVTLFQDIETIIKEPFNKSEKVLTAVKEAQEKFQISLTKLYPGNLVLSFNADVMHHRLVDKITSVNNVSNIPAEIRTLGEYMCIPFGKILRGIAVPNTITKSLHIEKMFEPEINRFKITEFPFYSPLINQIRTIKSFNKPILLVDDLLHKGYRMKELDPILKQENVNVSKIIVGILSGKGKDLMSIQGRRIESVYFIPNLRSWFVESSMYPFIGGDSVRRDKSINANLIPSINLILPYVAPNFLVDLPKEAIFDFSMTCLNNARSILSVLEEEYQLIYERNLTLNRLSEAVVSPRCPDKGVSISYDLNLAPSIYIKNDIENLIRLKNVIL